MRRNASSGTSSDGTLSESQRWSVIRVGAVAVAMVVTVPFYYGFVRLVPTIATIVPEIVPHAIMGTGLFVVFPGMFGYARVLKRRSDGVDPEPPPEYGVNDRWERRNL